MAIIGAKQIFFDSILSNLNQFTHEINKSSPVYAEGSRKDCCYFVAAETKVKRVGPTWQRWRELDLRDPCAVFTESLFHVYTIMTMEIQFTGHVTLLGIFFLHNFLSSLELVIILLVYLLSFLCAYVLNRLVMSNYLWPLVYSQPGSSVPGISQARIPE